MINLSLSEPDQIFWYVLLLCILAMVYSYYEVREFKKLKPIIILRTFLFGLILFLILDPEIELTHSNSRELKWHIYVDRSLSMTYHTHPSVGTLVTGIDKLLERIKQRDISYSVLGFGNDLDTSLLQGDKSISDGSTDFGKVLESIRLQETDGLAGSIIITDGQINLGPEIPMESLDIASPIHVIGVGDETPLVDVAIHSIQAPPVIIKGDKADLDVTISSYGKIQERLNVTLYSGSKLVGSNLVHVSGGGSQDRIQFQINPIKTGEARYTAKVNALAEEINIQNNKQVVPIQVLKNEYSIALITGAPNFNTQVIKRILGKNPRFRIDHFTYKPNEYSIPMKTFWDTNYDLIVFDNHPIQENANEWLSSLRVFAKKLISHKSSVAFVIGEDVHLNSLEAYLSLMDVQISHRILEIGTPYEWELNSNWDSFFPFESLHAEMEISSNLPPLRAGIELDSTNGTTLANYSISDVDVPLLMLGEKSQLRFMVWTSSDIYSLYHRSQGTKLSAMVSKILNPVFSWLMGTGGSQEFYFRSDKNSYQQGEKVTLIGKSIREQGSFQEGFVYISQNGDRINSKPIIFDDENKLLKTQFWASQSGQLDYEVELVHAGETTKVSEGSIQVQESQVELNRVYLNREPLMRLSDLAHGSFQTWDDRHKILDQIEPQSKTEIHYAKIILHDNIWLILFILGILTAEWVLRRRLGLM